MRVFLRLRTTAVAMPCAFEAMRYTNSALRQAVTRLQGPKSVAVVQQPHAQRCSPMRSLAPPYIPGLLSCSVGLQQRGVSVEAASKEASDLNTTSLPQEAASAADVDGITVAPANATAVSATAVPEATSDTSAISTNSSSTITESTSSDTAAISTSDNNSTATSSSTDGSKSRGDPEPPGLPKLEGSLATVWSGFVNQLWDRGFFSDLTSTDRHSAIASKRDIKKALQQFGRLRPDIFHLLPRDLISRLASLELPFAGELVINRKTLAAASRIAGAAAAADGVGSASTQDVLRVAWLFCSEEVTDVVVAPATSTITDILQKILELEQQPAQPDLLRTAAAAADTPDQEHYEKAHLKSGPGKRQPPQPPAAAQDVSSRSRSTKDDPSRRGSSSIIPAAAAPNVSAAVLHKLRLLRLSPYKGLRKGDWFCGVCGSHNFRGNLLCVKCEVPVGSLGNSTVSPMDEKQLEQVGLLQDTPWEARQGKVKFADQLAAVILDNSSSGKRKISLVEAAKLAGLGKFDPDAAAAAGSIRASYRGPSGHELGSSSSSDERDDDIAAAAAVHDARSRRGSSSRNRSQAPIDNSSSSMQVSSAAAAAVAAGAAANKRVRTRQARGTTSSSSSNSSLADVFKSAMAESAAALRKPKAAAAAAADSGSSVNRQKLFDTASASAAASTSEDAISQTSSTIADNAEPLSQQQQQQQSGLGQGRVRRIRSSNKDVQSSSSSSMMVYADGDDADIGDLDHDGAGPQGLTSSRRRRGDDHQVKDADHNADDGDLDYDGEMISTRRPRNMSNDSYDMRSDTYDRRSNSYERSNRVAGGSARDGSPRWRSEDSYDGRRSRSTGSRRDRDDRDLDHDRDDDDNLSGWAADYGDAFGDDDNRENYSSSRRGSSSRGRGSSSSRGRGRYEDRSDPGSRSAGDGAWGSSSSRRDRARDGRSSSSSTRGGSSSRSSRGRDKPAANPNWASIFNK